MRTSQAITTSSSSPLWWELNYKYINTIVLQPDGADETSHYITITIQVNIFFSTIKSNSLEKVSNIINYPLISSLRFEFKPDFD